MHYQDLAPGRRFRSGTRTVTADELVAFARTFDPQPLHLDPAAAAQGLFGSRIASGYHTLCLSWRLFIETGALGADGLAGLGLDAVRWHRPVWANDRIWVEAEVLESRPSASHPGDGIVRLRLDTRNEAGELVLSYCAAALVRGRPGAAAAKAAEPARP
jgi:acyl dehydratase